MMKERNTVELPKDSVVGADAADDQGPEGSEAVSAPTVLHRDPVDVRTILSLAWTGILLALLLVVSLAFNIYQYWRRPDRIVVDRSSGRVLMINDREYGATETVSLGPDRLTNADKQYIAGEFIRALYQIDPATRNKDIERALRMMVPDSALKFAQYLKRNGVLDKQRAESQQAIWTPQDVSVDQADPYTVRVIGKQEVTKVVSGATQTETRQLSMTLKLVADPLRRADRNLRSGFLVARFDDKELRSPGAADVSVNQ
ncbi:MAG: VirB8/TrbF family protein [Acidobacteria bacterium]|nr:VirB8/TrbF family protein [Acidobacteriota bacterium]